MGSEFIKYFLCHLSSYLKRVLFTEGSVIVLFTSILQQSLFQFVSPRQLNYDL